MCKMGTVTVYLKEVLKGLNVLIYRKHIEQCLYTVRAQQMLVIITVF